MKLLRCVNLLDKRGRLWAIEERKGRDEEGERCRWRDERDSGKRDERRRMLRGLKRLAGG